MEDMHACIGPIIAQHVKFELEGVDESKIVFIKHFF